MQTRLVTNWASKMAEFCLYNENIAVFDFQIKNFADSKPKSHLQTMTNDVKTRVLTPFVMVCNRGAPPKNVSNGFGQNRLHTMTNGVKTRVLTPFVMVCKMQKFVFYFEPTKKYFFARYIP